MGGAEQGGYSSGEGPRSELGNKQLVAGSSGIGGRAWDGASMLAKPAFVALDASPAGGAAAFGAGVQPVRMASMAAATAPARSAASLH